MSNESKPNRAQYMKMYRAEKRQNETDASRLLDEITRSYRANRKLIEAAMKSLHPGTKVYLDHCTALAKLDAAHRAELVERGLVPANLGAATGQGWRFVCTVTPRGETAVIEVRPNQSDPQSMTLPQRTEQDMEIIRELEVEYPSAVPAVRKEEE